MAVRSSLHNSSLWYPTSTIGNESQFGRDISAGFVRAAEKWGRREEDQAERHPGSFPIRGIPLHKEPRAQVYWGTAGRLDINEHVFDCI